MPARLVENATMEDQTGSPELFLFLASTVHDMKNSISVLSGTLENLLDARVRHPDGAEADLATEAGASAAAPAAAYPQMAQMLYQTKRLNDNLIQLLALYKEVGKPSYPFEPQPQLVSELVGQVASQARILLASKGITLDLDFPPELMDLRRGPHHRRAGPRHQQRHPLHGRPYPPVGRAERRLSGIARRGQRRRLPAGHAGGRRVGDGPGARQCQGQLPHQ